MKLHHAVALSTFLAACAAPTPPVQEPRTPAPAAVRCDPSTPTPTAAIVPERQAGAEIRLLPKRNAAGEIDRLDVAARVWPSVGKLGKDGVFAARIYDVVEGDEGFSEKIFDVAAHDEQGDLPLTRTPTKDEQGNAYVEWTSARKPVGAVDLRYYVAVSPSGNTYFSHNGIRAHAGGFQGLGYAFLVLPEGEKKVPVKIRWDLSNSGPNATAYSSWGPGDVENTATLDQISEVIFMAAPTGALTFDEGNLHLRSVWLGKPAFDPTAVLSWVKNIRTMERAFWNDDDPTPYYIFTRVSPNLTTWIGSSKPTAFFLIAGGRFEFGRYLRFTLTHEMMHRWIGNRIRFDVPEGTAYWFTEGFTVHYTRMMLLRHGFIPPEEFLEDLHERLHHYIVNPQRNAPNRVVAEKFWSDRDVEKLPYQRGGLYAAEVDAMIRARSGETRSLDDVMFELHRQALARGGPLPAGTWRELVGKELGPEGQARYDAVIERGEDVFPPPRAFGPCFERKPIELPQYDIGFDFRLADVKDGRLVIKGLRAGSAAARAGLREGDITKPQFMVGALDQKVKFTAKRDGKDVVVEYFPHGAKVRGFTWQRAAKVPASDCVDKKPSGKL